MKRSIVCAVTVWAMLLPAASSAQSVLERTPNIPGAWVGRSGMAYFNFSHRFYLLDNEGGEDRILNAPTFLLGYSVANMFLIGAHYSSSSRTVPLHPNEWEGFLRYAPLQAASGLPFELALTGGYNGAAESVDGEITVGYSFGSAKLLGAFRAFSNGFGSDSTRAAIAGGARVKLHERVALAGDVVTPFSKRDNEVVGWSAALQLEIPATPHSVSLHAANTTTSTMQGASRGVPKVGAGGGTRWGFEFTVPITLSRFLGGGGGQDLTITADTVRVPIRDFEFAITRLTVRPGTTVIWVNEGNVPHTSTSDDRSWASPLLSRGESYSRVFNDVGEFPYFCEPHPFMRGVVVVQAG